MRTISCSGSQRYKLYKGWTSVTVEVIRRKKLREICSQRSNVVEQMSAYDFNIPVTITMIYEDSDEDKTDSFEDIKEELKEELEPQHYSENKKCSNESQKTVLNESSEIQTKEVAKKCTDKSSKRKSVKRKQKDSARESSISPKVTKCTSQIERHLPRDLQKDVTPASVESVLNHQENVSTMNANNESSTQFYLTNLLKSVSEYFSIILEAHCCHANVQSNPQNSQSYRDRSSELYMRIKTHFFNLAYCTFDTLILPQENNKRFVKKFLHDTYEMAKLKNDLRCYWEIVALYKEMIDWAKIKKMTLTALPIQNVSIIEKPQNNLLKEKLTKPPKSIIVSAKPATFPNTAVDGQLSRSTYYDHNHNLQKKPSKNAIIEPTNPGVSSICPSYEVCPPQWNISQQLNSIGESMTPNTRPAVPSTENSLANSTWMNQSMEQPKTNIIPYEGNAMPRNIGPDGSAYLSKQNVQLWSKKSTQSNYLVPSETVTNQNQIAQDKTDNIRYYTLQHKGYEMATQNSPLAVSANNPPNYYQHNKVHPANIPFTGAVQSPYAEAYYWQNQTQYGQPAQKRPMQNESTCQQNQPEIIRSISRDSGFTSPVHFNSPEPMNFQCIDPAEPTLQVTPLITHVTSLNPNVSYIEEGSCHICNKITKKKCLGCLKCYYCSFECQRQDWPVHMPNCKKN